MEEVAMVAVAMVAAVASELTHDHSGCHPFPTRVAMVAVQRVLARSRVVALLMKPFRFGEGTNNDLHVGVSGQDVHGVS